MDQLNQALLSMSDQRVRAFLSGLLTRRKVIKRQDWERWLKGVKIRREGVNDLVLNFLVTEAYAEAAEKFRNESGTEYIDLGKIEERMAIKKAVQSGDIEGAIGQVNYLNPEILDTNPHIFFRLQQQRFIELVRDQKVLEALEVSMEDLAPMAKENPRFLEELERTVVMLAFDDVNKCPSGQLMEMSHRFEIASEVNAAILTSQGREKEPELTNYLKMLIRAQRDHDVMAAYPRIRDLCAATPVVPGP